MAGNENEESLEAEASASASASASAQDAEDAPGEEEDTGAEVAPIIRLDAVAVTTGEEDEDALIDLKAKLYRFDKDGNQWKERGVGQVRLLKHKVTGKIRLLMRQNKTLKICANHTVLPTATLQEHQGNDKTWVWHAPDFADGEVKNELFCIRFGSVENAQNFKIAYEEAQVAMSGDRLDTEEEGAADSAAELIRTLTVEEKSGEKKEVEAEEPETGTEKEKDVVKEEEKSDAVAEDKE